MDFLAEPKVLCSRTPGCASRILKRIHAKAPHRLHLVGRPSASPSVCTCALVLRSRRMYSSLLGSDVLPAHQSALLQVILMVQELNPPAESE